MHQSYTIIKERDARQTVQDDAKAFAVLACVAVAFYAVVQGLVYFVTMPVVFN